MAERAAKLSGASSQAPVPSWGPAFRNVTSSKLTCKYSQRWRLISLLIQHHRIMGFVGEGDPVGPTLTPCDSGDSVPCLACTLPCCPGHYIPHPALASVLILTPIYFHTCTVAVVLFVFSVTVYIHYYSVGHCCFLKGKKGSEIYIFEIPHFSKARMERWADCFGPALVTCGLLPVSWSPICHPGSGPL